MKRNNIVIDNYINSLRFLRFQDKELRIFACDLVDHFLENYSPVKGSQLNLIPAIIQAYGLNGLKELIDNQRNKNTYEKNKIFWGFLHNVVFDDAADSGNSLRRFVVKELSAYRDESGAAIFDDEANYSDRVGKKKAKKENNKMVERALNELVKAFFEHFNCHYFYKTVKERSRD